MFLENLSLFSLKTLNSDTIFLDENEFVRYDERKSDGGGDDEGGHHAI